MRSNTIEPLLVNENVHSSKIPGVGTEKGNLLSIVDFHCK